MGSDLDLVILDVMLPGRSGLEILEEIRAVKPALPVIMLTARGEVADKVAGLDAGATDYMTKPFSVEELLARVRAHLRTPVQAETTRLRVADIELDLLRRAREPRRGAGRTSRPRSSTCWRTSCATPVRCSRASRSSTASGTTTTTPGTNIVEVYVGYLRRKLALADRPVPIQTVRSAGYRLVDG